MKNIYEKTRLELGLTRAAIASAIGISYSYWYNLETNVPNKSGTERQLSMDTFSRLDALFLKKHGRRLDASKFSRKKRSLQS